MSKLEKLERQLTAINEEIRTAQGLRRAGLFIRRDAIVKKLREAKPE